ncbi:MAG TPA: YraN family protein [Clostridiaceae bacterium]|nr:YraN family protein [Clostridiaceae bacterium]
MYVSHELGRIGENIIADYITKLGYKVVERNFECNQGEIDIIAKDKEELVFIEVKTRTDISYGEASEAVTDTKKRHLINSIKYYIYKQKLENQPIRIDVAEVYIKCGKVKINYIKQAIY